MSDTTPDTLSPPQEPDAPSSTPGDSGGFGGDEKLVPVTEAIRYRRRAQQAESHSAAQAAQLAELRAQLVAAEARVTELERRGALDAALAEADVADLDAGRTLAEAALASMETPDVDKAIAELQRRKPYLFRTRDAAASPARSPRLDDLPGVTAPVEHAAQQARVSGDRRDLLAYLRLRRTASH